MYPVITNLRYIGVIFNSPLIHNYEQEYEFYNPLLQSTYHSSKYEALLRKNMSLNLALRQYVVSF